MGNGRLVCSPVNHLGTAVMPVRCIICGRFNLISDSFPCQRNETTATVSQSESNRSFLSEPSVLSGYIEETCFEGLIRLQDLGEDELALGDSMIERWVGEKDSETLDI